MLTRCALVMLSHVNFHDIFHGCVVFPFQSGFVASIPSTSSTATPPPEKMSCRRVEEEAPELACACGVGLVRNGMYEVNVNHHDPLCVDGGD